MDELDEVLFAILCGLLLLNWPVAFVLTREALRPPRIRALTVEAIGSIVIAVSMTVYVALVLARDHLHIINEENFRLLFRGSLVLLGAFPLAWLYVYLTDGFRDRH